MENIRQKKLNVGPILNFINRLYRQFQNKKFGTHIHKSMIFKALKK